MRYCLDATSRNLYRQVQTWTSQDAPAAPSSNTCPDSGWPSVGGASARVVASAVNNRHNNRTGGNSEDRPVFLYYDSADLTSINTVRMNLWIDVTPGPTRRGTIRRRPRRTWRAGSSFRNQNRPPTSSFQATTQGNHGLKLNGSASADPEGAEITYTWWANGSKTPPAPAWYATGMPAPRACTRSGWTRSIPPASRARVHRTCRCHDRPPAGTGRLGDGHGDLAHVHHGEPRPGGGAGRRHPDAAVSPRAPRRVELQPRRGCAHSGVVSADALVAGVAPPPPTRRPATSPAWWRTARTRT